MPNPGLLSDIGFETFHHVEAGQNGWACPSGLRGWAFDFGGCRVADMTKRGREPKANRQPRRGCPILNYMGYFWLTIAFLKLNGICII